MNQDFKSVLSQSSLEEGLAFLARHYEEGEVAFSTSLSHEDQLIMDAIFQNDLNITVFTLDTGRLFEETYTVLAENEKKYNRKIKVFFPERQEVEDMVTEGGINLFYDSAEKRKRCCHIRKVKPLKKALKGCKVWITGLRKEQGKTRHNLDKWEWDASYNLHKYHPLLDWSLEAVKAEVKKKGIPSSALYEKGFLSIGCSPCTRPVTEGNDPRSGRWWWEKPEQKECGLHANYFKEVKN